MWQQDFRQKSSKFAGTPTSLALLFQISSCLRSSEEPSWQVSAVGTKEQYGWGVAEEWRQVPCTLFELSRGHEKLVGIFRVRAEET